MLLAITAPEIKKAMSKLGKPDENQSRAVDVRQELDLKIGCAFTRFQTKYFQGKYGNLDSRLVSFGPCQTPTLALCVKRHDEILSFEPKKFWSLSALIDPGCGPLRFQSTRGRIFEKKRATDTRESLRNIKEAKIVKVLVEKKSIQRPQALNTVEMLKNASTGLGISPQQCMHIAERLYIQGYISYPRTETTKYSKEFDMNGLLSTMSQHPLWCVY
jgi:DNA topoisomerase-3